MDYDIIGITVFCKNTDYIPICLGSFRGYYDIPLIIIDNSENDQCTKGLIKYNKEDNKSRLIINEKNLGHGAGLIQGIKYVDTRYVLIFDSDVKFINKNLIPDMLSLMDEDKYGIGFTMWTLKCGGTASPWKIDESRPKDAIKYLHPFCALLSMKMYKKYPPFNQKRSAPTIDAMVAINNEGLENKLIIHLPGSSYKNCKYWQHTSGASRIIINKIKKSKR